MSDALIPPKHYMDLSNFDQTETFFIGIILRTIRGHTLFREARQRNRRLR